MGNTEFSDDVYTEDYDATVDRANQERNQNVRPELVSHVDNMEDYDNIILKYWMIGVLVAAIVCLIKLLIRRRS